MVNLREAILRIAHHFISVDPKLNEVSLVPDYSTESHTKDHENYNIVSENRRRRAKALLGKKFRTFALILEDLSFITNYRY